jgi:hypothetical protein
MPDFEDLDKEPTLDEEEEVDNSESGEEEASDQTPDEGTTEEEEGTEGDDFSEFDNIDPKKLPAELQGIYKRMQAGLTKKFQEMSEREKLLLQTVKKPEEPPKKKTIYELFDEKPVDTLRDINAHIKKLKTDEDTDPAEIEKWQELKEELLAKQLERGKEKDNVQAIFHQANIILSQRIPNFQQKMPHLFNFAVKELDLTPEEVNYITSPVAHGQVGLKITLAVNKLYDRLRASKTVKGKENRTPTPVESAGKGDRQGGSKGLLSEEALKKKALASGSVDDFAALIAARRRAATR